MAKASVNDLQKFRCLCPTESIGSVGRILRYIRKKNLHADEVAFICIRHELVRPLRDKYPDLRFFSVDEIVELKGTAETANRFVKGLEPRLVARAKESEFLWSLLYHLHLEYLLHLHSCYLLADKLIELSTLVQTWILTPAGALFGNRCDLFGDRNPLFYLILRDRLADSGRRYIACANPALASPVMLSAIQAASILLNLLVFVGATAFNRFVGYVHTTIERVARWRGRSHHAGLEPTGGVLAFFREPFGFADPDRTREHLWANGVGLYQVNFEHLRLGGATSIWRGMVSLARRCVKVIVITSGQLLIGRVDPRVGLSRWFVLYLHAAQGLSVGDYGRLVALVWRQLRYAYRVVDEAYWGAHAGQISMMRRYTQLVIAGFVIEYMYSRLLVTSLLRRIAPSVVVYPDGYSILVRVLQWRAMAGEYQGLQVPHGYPNRRFPSYYYSAYLYVAPTELTVRQLRGYGIQPQSIVRTPHRLFATREDTNPATETAEPLLNNGMTSSANILSPTIAIMYTGTYAIWSFPNRYSDLEEASCALIRGLIDSLPEATIVLKSHPNGTSPEFFAGLKLEFAEYFDLGKLVHISKGWSKVKDYLTVNLAIGLLAHPSTPLIYCLKYGIPLIVVSEPSRSDPDLLYYPTCANISDYPFLVNSVNQAISEARRILSGAEKWNVARDKMRSYGRTLVAHGKRDHVPEFWEILQGKV